MTFFLILYNLMNKQNNGILVGGIQSMNIIKNECTEFFLFLSTSQHY